MSSDISSEIYQAAARAMLPFDQGEPDEIDYFEWHHCMDQPNCAAAKDANGRNPCACSGTPWPSPAVRAAIDAAVVRLRELDAEAEIRGGHYEQ